MPHPPLPNKWCCWIGVEHLDPEMIDISWKSNSIQLIHGGLLLHNLTVEFVEYSDPIVHTQISWTFVSIVSSVSCSQMSTNAAHILARTMGVARMVWIDSHAHVATDILGVLVNLVLSSVNPNYWAWLCVISWKFLVYLLNGWPACIILICEKVNIITHKTLVLGKSC